MNFDQAKEYLARVMPWPQDGDPPAYVNLHWTFQSPDRDKPGWGGRACRSVTEAVNALQYALKNNTTRDIYVCLSAQAQAEAVHTEKGWTFYKPVRSQNNAVSLKSLFLDIDCKDGPNGYPDQASATTALVEFLKATGMPRPTLVVGSGGGMHVYWTLSEALHPAKWKPLARALAEATKANGLKCDTQVTVDAARILRVPDTFNLKTGQPRPVRLLGTRLEFDYSYGKLKQILEPFIDAGDEPVLPPRTPLVPVIDELGSNIESNKAPPPPIAEVAAQCAFVRDAITSGGKDYAEPLWHLTTLLSVFTQEGRQAAHMMAHQHDGYTVESTDALFDRKEREREDRGLGWPHCRTISATGCTACNSCIHFAAGKTPLHYAKPLIPAAQNKAPPADWDLPKGYVRDSDNRVHRVVVQQDGSSDLVPVLNYPMFDPWLQKNPWILNFTTETHSGHTQRVALAFSEALAQGGVRSVLGKQGIAIRGGRSTQMVEEFIVSWIEKLQKQKNAVVSSAPFGWLTRDGKTEGFVYANQLWTPNGESAAAVPDPVLAQAFTPTGDIQPWIEAAKLVTSQGRAALNALLASAFAAPLVKFTGREGVLMAVYSTSSGIGKTTAMKVAQAVWGDPVKAMFGLDDTHLDTLGRMGKLRSLPVYWDELKTEEDTKKFVNMVFTLTRGKERNRMTSDISHRLAGSWQTMLISASNESIIDYVVSRTKTSPAGLMRAFEYEVPSGNGIGKIATADADLIIARLNDNFGHVGLEYAKWLGANFPTIEADVAEMRKQIEIETKASEPERYWSSMIAVLLCGARYAKQLGFLDIDGEELKCFMLDRLESMRTLVKSQANDMSNSTNVENILAQFLNYARARHTLWTNIIPLTRGRPHNVTVVRDSSKLETILVHVGVDNKILRLSSGGLSEWCHMTGYSKQIINNALEKEYGCKKVVGRMGAGTQFASIANEYLIEIQLAGTPLASVLGKGDDTEEKEQVEGDEK